jgi:hypothetical protein
MWVPAGLLNTVQWRKSTRSSGGQSNCVEIAYLAGEPVVRDSKNSSAGGLSFGSCGWTQLLRTLSSPNTH